jgi:hypothetical protein
MYKIPFTVVMGLPPNLWCEKASVLFKDSTVNLGLPRLIFIVKNNFARNKVILTRCPLTLGPKQAIRVIQS